MACSLHGGNSPAFFVVVVASRNTDGGAYNIKPCLWPAVVVSSRVACGCGVALVFENQLFKTLQNFNFNL
jgi:hypothetical protein